MSQKDFYHEIYQERRCQVGLHNFPSYENERDNEPVLCKRCKFMKLPYNPYSTNIVDIFKKIQFAHKNDN